MGTKLMDFQPIPALRVQSQRVASKTAEMYEAEADVLEAQIEDTLRRAPIEGCRSFLGRVHLQRFGWLLSDSLVDAVFPWPHPPSAGAWSGAVQEHLDLTAETGVLRTKCAVRGYPRQCAEILDVVFEAQWIAAQLAAEEYLEEAGELTPFTLEAFEDAALDESAIKERRGRFQVDVFATNWRPPVEVTLGS